MYLFKRIGSIGTLRDCPVAVMKNSAKRRLVFRVGAYDKNGNFFRRW